MTPFLVLLLLGISSNGNALQDDSKTKSPGSVQEKSTPDTTSENVKQDKSSSDKKVVPGKGSKTDSSQDKSGEKKSAKKSDAKADDKGTQATSKDEKKGFAELMADWVTLEGKFKALEAEFKVVKSSRQDEIRKEYTGLVAEANSLTGKLRSAAIKDYQSAPNQNSVVLRLLIGMLVDDLAKDRSDDFFQLGDILIKGKIDVAHFRALHKSKRLLAERTAVAVDELIARHRDAERGDLPRATIKTSYGDIEIELFEDDAPNHVANFIYLVKEKKLYTNSSWHRVEPSDRDPLGREFVYPIKQGGAPGEGVEELDYTIADEALGPEGRHHIKGHIGMAKTAAPHSASSEFYIMTDRYSSFDGRYTVFGRVISGMDAVHQIKQGDKILSISMSRDRGKDYKPVKYDPNAAPNGNEKNKPKGPEKKTEQVEKVESEKKETPKSNENKAVEKKKD